MCSVRVISSRVIPRRISRRLRFPIRIICVLAALTFAALVPAQAQQMKLLTPSTGWISKDNHLYWTTNSGGQWSDITPVPPGAVRAGVSIRSVFFLNTQEGWVVISHPQQVVPLTLKALRTRKTLYDIAQTVDGGETWSFLPLAYPQLPQWQQEALAGPGNMYFLDSLHGWLVMAMMGSSNFEPGKLLATDDGGRNWKWVKGPGTIGSLLFTSTKDGWLSGGPNGLRLFATHDGCETWQRINLEPPSGLHVSPQAVYEGPPLFTDPQHAYVAARYDGNRGAPSRLIVFTTADAGRTWKPVRILQDSWEGGVLPVALADSTLVVPSGFSVKAVHVATVHLKGNLTSSVVVSHKGLYGMTFVDAAHGLVYTESGLLYTSDGGSTWRNVTPWPMPKPSPPPPGITVRHPKIEMEVKHLGPSKSSDQARH
jgi:photosystem II stability/assembly factor-like uncharacterized protein